MVLFGDLPNELLLKVARGLRNSFNGQLHLARLAFTSRQMYLVVNDVLYRAPDLMSLTGAVSSDQFGEADSYLPRMALFLRTMLERPDRALHVHQLKVTTFHRPVDHSKTCLVTNAACEGYHFDCHCGWDDLKRHAFTDMESGLLGAILVRLPRLETILVYPFAMTDYYHEFDNFRKLPYSPTDVSTSAMFGQRLNATDVAQIPGLANLKSITSNYIVSGSLLFLPSLQTLQFGINPTRKAMPDFVELRPPILFSVLTYLVVQLWPGCLQYWGHTSGFGDLYLGDLLQHLTCLQYLCLQLTAARSDIAEIQPIYGNLLLNLRSNSLRTLIIDVSDMGPPTHVFNYSHRILPIGCLLEHATLRQFPNLRRLVAPQDALISVPANRYDSGTAPVSRTFCPSIECIEVIDSTKALNKFVKDIINNGETFLNLKEIKLWCDKLEVPLDQHDSYLDDPNPYVDEAMLQQFRVDNSIWDDLQRAGIKVSMIMQKTRGWRDFSNESA